jgi:RNA 2',3'-cyclic 3'-phosphodiesterase
MTDEPKHRLFVAVELPEPIRDAIEDLVEPLRSIDGFRWTPVGNLHLTLAFLGWVEPDTVDPIRERLPTAATALEPFEARLAGVGRFPERGKARVLWVGFDDPTGSLAELSATVARSLEGLFQPDERPFRPHVTVARARRPVAVRLPALDVAPRAFPVEQISLFRSFLGGQHARYEALARWPLGAQPSRIP